MDGVCGHDSGLSQGKSSPRLGFCDNESLRYVLSQLHFASSFILPPERLQKGHPQGDLEIIRAPWVVLFFCSQW